MVYVEDDSTMYVPNCDALESEAGVLDHLTGKAAILSHPGQIRIRGQSIYSRRFVASTRPQAPVGRRPRSRLAWRVPQGVTQCHSHNQC